MIVMDAQIEKLIREIPHNDARRVQSEIVTRNFEWGDLVPQYRGVGPTSGNVFCVMHPNYSSPAAKIYEDEDRNIFVLHCFSEHRTFTTYDYVSQKIIGEFREYNNVWEFLVDNMDTAELIEEIQIVHSRLESDGETALESKIEYINNMYNEFDDVSEFINHLYLEK